MARHAARRAAMQLIYEGMLGGGGGSETLEELIGFAQEDNEDGPYIRSLVDGVAGSAALLDAEVAKRSSTRELDRIPKVVLAILRLSIYELAFLQDSPQSVIINEAVELAKRYGEESDSRFINGLLGNYVREHPEP
jgi:N utilization substance protein B